MAPLPRELLPTCDLSRVISIVPAVLSAIPPEDRAALLSCSKQLREVVHQSTQTLTVCDATCRATDFRGSWPRLTLVIAKKGVTLWQASKHMQLLWSVHTKHSGQGQQAYVVCPKAEDGQPQPQAVQSRHSAIAFSNLAKSDLRNADHVTVLHNTLGADGITVVGVTWPNLTYLSVRHTRLDTSAWSQVAQGSWPTLELLDVTDCKLDIDSIRSLAEGDWPSLHTLLLLYNSSLGADALQLISQGSWWPRLSRLGLGWTKLDAASLREVSHMNRRLDGLFIHTSALDTMSVSVLTDVQWPCMSHLALDSCSLDTEGVALLARCSLQNLSILSLKNNRLNAAAASQLARGSWQALTKLVLTNNCLGNTSMQHLARGQWPRLQTLKLDANPFDYHGLGHLMVGNWALQSLTLSTDLFDAQTMVMLSVNPHSTYRTTGKTKTVYRSPAVLPGQQRLIWPALLSVDFLPQPFSKSYNCRTMVYGLLFYGLIGICVAFVVAVKHHHRHHK